MLKKHVTTALLFIKGYRWCINCDRNQDILMHKMSHNPLNLPKNVPWTIVDHLMFNKYIMIVHNFYHTHFHLFQAVDYLFLIDVTYTITLCIM